MQIHAALVQTDQALVVRAKAGDQTAMFELAWQ